MHELWDWDFTCMRIHNELSELGFIQHVPATFSQLDITSLTSFQLQTAIVEVYVQHLHYHLFWIVY